LVAEYTLQTIRSFIEIMLKVGEDADRAVFKYVTKEKR